jgi:ATP-dependent DNA helicase PIF1
MPSNEDKLLALNKTQREAYDSVALGNNVFITGPGGTGKSFLMRTLFDVLPKKLGKTVALTALTGCAALLIHPKAKTLHSWAGVGLGKDPPPVLISTIRTKNRRAQSRWISTDILVIDEVSMLTKELFETLDIVGRAIRRNETQPFGGLQMVLVGDFFQLPPIMKSDISGASPPTVFVFESPLWKTLSLETFSLTEIVRQKDPIFQTILNEARYGTLSKNSIRTLAKRMNLDYSKEEIKPTMLFTRRAEVDDINMSHLKKLTTERKTFKVSTLIVPLSGNENMNTEDPFLKKAILKLDSDAPYSPDLTVAVGAQVMLLINMTEMGLVNGSRGVVTGYGPVEKKDDSTPIDPTLLVPIVKFKNGLEFPVAHDKWEVPDFPGVFRKQIPLRLAYAVTVHKSQGSTLDCALIDVGSSTFEYGQAYVALSRVKDMNSLYIHDLEASAFRAHPKVKSFYKEENE